MTRRLSLLKRLEAVYTLVEDLHSVALRQTSIRMNEADAAIAEQLARLHASRSQGREALDHGDREAWSLAETQRELASRNRERLELVRLEREKAQQFAREQYVASRLQREQIKSVVESGAKAEQIVEGRQTQAAADDRFLARLYWNKLRFETV